MKRLVNEGWDKPMQTALRMEHDAFAVHGRSKDLREGLAAFNEKRVPSYSGE